MVTLRRRFVALHLINVGMMSICQNEWLFYSAWFLQFLEISFEAWLRTLSATGSDEPCSLLLHQSSMLE